MTTDLKYRRVMRTWTMIIVSWIVLTLSMQSKTIDTLSKERIYLRERLFSEMSIRQQREAVISLQAQRHQDYEQEIAVLKLQAEMERADFYISRVNKNLSSENRRRIVAAVYRCSLDQNIDPALGLAVMEQESRFDIFAKSNKDARGLMQLLPSTAKDELGIPVSKIYQIEKNVCGGVAYLSRHLHRYNGVQEAALRRYYGGGELWEYPQPVLNRYAKILKEIRR